MSNTFDRVLFRLFIFWYINGVVLLSFDILPPALEWANAVFLILSGLLGVVYFLRNYGQAIGGIISALIFIVTLLAEAIGVHYGLFFGHYYYNPDFGLVIMDLPLTIGFAWLMVIATTHVISKQLVHMIDSTWLKGLVYVVVASLAAVVIDLIIDPVAFHVKEYWIWHQGGLYYDIPFSNFAGWFWLAFILHSIIFIFLTLKKLWVQDVSRYWTDRMVWLFLLMIVMFMIIAATAGLWLSIIVTAIPMILLLLGYFISRKKESEHQ
ncbi:carotenoid biosynthesis protein [Bacillus sp. FJAT-45037]|uniref:carotenoid biosynthesis protein n=1 Tax=Bacillus sp. FJAT-45037 TaxID=2011007 RepID=UPI0012FE1C0E|nr:carotenoid biosynthesis protein [Bacillus sp. FJAT-45037]